MAWSKPPRRPRSLAEYQADQALTEKGKDVMLFAGVSALSSAVASLLWIGIPRKHPRGAVVAWVLGTVLLGAGAAGVTYYLASRPVAPPA